MFSCFKPILINREGVYSTVPCGKCVDCRKRLVSGWAFRLMEEERICSSSYFLTLTYDDKKIPISDNGYQTIQKRDLQLFMKRLRKRNGEKLRYYACGEYGSKSHRPHYHMLLFNAAFDTIESSWKLGNIHYGDVTDNSIFYTLKYMNKKGIVGKKLGDDRVKEFAIMSKGIGKNYLQDKNVIKWHKEDLTERMFCNLKEGRRILMPRYYKDKMYTKDERLELKGYWTEKVRIETEKLILKPEVNKIIREYKESCKSAERNLIINNQKELL